MDDSPPPRRKPDKLRAHREMRDRAVREIRALLDLYWDMCGSWCALDDHDDIELWRRMMNTRTHVMALVIALMPVPTADAFTEEELLPDLRAMH